MDLKGIRTSASSRAYHTIYPPRQSTAPIVQRLIDLGAIIVGKTRTGQFAIGTDPTESFDFFSNLNPRGEGFQSQAGSSSASAGAVAGYDWLDVALGTDSEFHSLNKRVP